METNNKKIEKRQIQKKLKGKKENDYKKVTNHEKVFFLFLKKGHHLKKKK